VVRLGTPHSRYKLPVYINLIFLWTLKLSRTLENSQCKKPSMVWEVAGFDLGIAEQQLWALPKGPTALTGLYHFFILVV
jgi:hypothetical protein